MTGRRGHGEFDLIARFFEPLSHSAPGAFALGNDGALLTPPADASLVVTKDLMVAGVHYPEGEEPAVLARRLLRVNLSDLAAMGAIARSYALGLALPFDVGDAWVEAFAAGLARDQEAFGISLIGGDTVATEGPAVLSLTAFGTVENGAFLPRAGAREGDDIYVSGTIGDATLGLRAVQGGLAALPPEDRAALAERFRLPEPRLALGTALLGLATCAIDISDGLVADLGHICAESGAAARIEADAVPLSDPARRALAAGDAGIADLVTGGDDYELLFCAPSSERETIDALGCRLDLALTRIGVIEAGQGVTVLRADGQPLTLSRAGYRHF
ncbi:MAG: thiamine-phosphate kinase [Rhodospirillaceae bacterium]|nr:thiamine-phosphate kinase [Rhodospirillaceae bacterium]